MNTRKWLWGYLKKHSKMYFFAYFLVIVFLSVSLSVPWIMGKMVDEVIRDRMVEKLWPYLIALVSITIFRTAIMYIHQMIFERVSQNTIHDMRNDTYDKLNRQDFNFYDTNRTGDIMARLTGDMEAVRHFVAGALPQVLKSGFQLLLAVAMMFFIHPVFALSILLVAPFVALVGVKFAKTVLPKFYEIRAQFSKLNTTVQENVSGNRVVKAFAKEAFEVEKFDRENDKYMQTNMDASKVWQKYLPVLEFLSNIMKVFVILLGGIFIINGSLTIGEMVIFTGLIDRVNGPMRMLGWLINDMQRFFASGDKIRQMQDEQPGITNEGFKMTELELKGGVEFRDVSFSYKEAAVLHDINFKILPGQKAAFIGATGSGKSTVMNLICRFYETDEGLVLLDRVNVRNIDLTTLRTQVAIAMQDVFLFTDTIEGNIAYGNPEATLEDVVAVARMAEANEFIERFPEGYDTVVGERGVGLSGGQRQRIALARTLLKNPSVLILDDTTSSLDVETEYRIQTTLEAFSQTRTTLLIAHRISSVKSADIIFVLEGGCIVEQGTHEELVAAGGIYTDVYVNQMGDFDEYTALSGNQEILPDSLTTEAAPITTAGMTTESEVTDNGQK